MMNVYNGLWASVRTSMRFVRLSVCALAVTMLLLYPHFAVSQVPNPQIPLTGTAGAAGNFPLLNSGTFPIPSDADFTPTFPNTTCIVCKVTSSVSLTATRNLIEPTAGMTFNITNSTTGGQSIVVKAATGTGVTIANGTSKWVWFDGTNYVEIDPPAGGGGCAEGTCIQNVPVNTQVMATPIAKAFTETYTSWDNAVGPGGFQYAHGISCNPYETITGDAGGSSVIGATACLEGTSVFNTPGWAYSFAAPFEFTYYGMYSKVFGNTMGITAAVNGEVVKSANQEFSTANFVGTSAGNCWELSAECATGIQNQLKFMGGAGAGMTSTAGTGALTLLTTGFSNQVGPSRVILDTQTATTATQTLGTAFGENNGIVTANLSIATTASIQGTMAADVNTPRVANNGTTVMTITINLASAYVGSATALMTCAGYGNVEVTRLASVGTYTAGVQTVTAPLMRPFVNTQVFGNPTYCFIGGSHQGYWVKNTSAGGGDFYNQIVGTGTGNTAFETSLFAGNLVSDNVQFGYNSVTLCPLVSSVKTCNVTLYPGAEIQSIASNRTTVNVRPNSVTWTSGDTLLIPEGIAARNTLQNNIIFADSPFTTHQGISVGYLGPAPAGESDFFVVPIAYSNNSLLSQGGIGHAFNLFKVSGGPVGIALDLDVPPQDAFLSGNAYTATILNVNATCGGGCPANYNIFTDTTLSQNGSFLNFIRASSTYNFGASVGSAVLQENGSEVCTVVNALCTGSGNTTSTALTTPCLTKANGTNSIITSSVCDNGTLVTITEPVTITTGSGLGGGFDGTEGTAHTGASSTDSLWADSTAHRLKMNNNNGGAFFVPGVATAGTLNDCVKFAANGIDLVDAGAACGTGGSAFNAITSGTNTTAAMVVGSGSSLAVSGSGTIGATTLLGNTWAAPGNIGATTPGTGKFSSLTVSGQTGSTQCASFDTSGNLTGVGAPCGTSGSGITGLTANFIPLAGSATTITANSPLNYGVTTASTLTDTALTNVNLTGGTLPTLPANTVLAVANVSATATRIASSSFGATSFFSVLRADGTSASPTQVLAGEQVGGINAWAWNSSAAYNGPIASLRYFADENQTATAAGSRMDFITTPDGATTAISRMSIENDGRVIIAGIASSTSPICPNGTGGALTTSGCATGSAPTFQVNGTNLTTATTINFRTGSGNGGVVMTNPSVGNVDANLSMPFDATGTNFMTTTGTFTATHVPQISSATGKMVDSGFAIGGFAQLAGSSNNWTKMQEFTVGSTITAASTVAPTTPIVLFTGNSTAVDTITAPLGTGALIGASFDWTAATAGFSFTTAGNIANALTTSQANQSGRCVFNGTTNGKWVCTTLFAPGSTTVTPTAGTGVTSVTCATATCTTARGSYTIVGGTGTTGTVASLAWTATGTAWVCTATMNGGATAFNIGNSVATTTGMNITAGISVVGSTFTVNYSCVP